MKIFLAGIIQGSKVEPEIHRQDWRGPIRAAIERHLRGAEVYCHFSRHPNSIEYDLPEIRRTFTEGLRQVADSDVLVAYLPGASMGTAIEMAEAVRAGAVVLTITPLAANWVVRAYSDAAFPDVESFEAFLASGELAGLIAAKQPGRDWPTAGSGDPMSISVLEMTIDELSRALVEAGEQAYRARQLADWVYRKGVTDPAMMTNLPAGTLEKIAVLTSRLIGRTDSRDGAIKLLLEFPGLDEPAKPSHVETVLIPEALRTTACLSTQVGCAMGCTFCASQIGGLDRNCTSGEMLQQVLHLQHASEQRVTNVVFMGMGEPLANFDELARALDALTDPQRFGLSARKITVSTIGLPEGIRRLTALDLPVTLAISLHAPDDELRRRLIPPAKAFSIDQVIAAAREFYHARKREVTLEYLMLAGVNDTPQQADQLAHIARKLRCNVNLISYNPVDGLAYRRPTAATVKAFSARLASKGINVHTRRSRGLDASAACGQLRRRVAEGTASPGEGR
jgi:23S rRNA (adenine2503-C2)-methyltransferase